MSKINIGNITATNVVLGNNNTVTYNQGNGSVELSKQEREVIDELLNLIKPKKEQKLFLEDVSNYKSTDNIEEKKTIGKKLLSTVSKVVNVASATDTGFSLYERFVEFFPLITK